MRGGPGDSARRITRRGCVITLAERQVAVGVEEQARVCFAEKRESERQGKLPRVIIAQQNEFAGCRCWSIEAAITDFIAIGARLGIRGHEGERLAVQVERQWGQENSVPIVHDRDIADIVDEQLINRLGGDLE